MVPRVVGEGAACARKPLTLALIFPTPMTTTTCSAEPTCCSASRLCSLLSPVLRIAQTVSASALLLLIRVVWGVQFFQTGLGKLNNLDRTAGFFESLGIPAPGFHAAFVGGLECVGGALLVVGLGARLVSLPLAGSMLVALLTAHREDFLGTAKNPVTGFDHVTKLFEAAPGPFLIASLIVLVFGSGCVSLDATVRRWCTRKSKKSTCGASATCCG